MRIWNCELRIQMLTIRIVSCALKNYKSKKGAPMDKKELEKRTKKFALEVIRFVADLPISVGVELGFTFLMRTNMEFLHETATSISGVESTQTYYTEEKTSSTLYDELDVKQHKLGTDVRFTLSYYFNK